jgi:DNA primase
MIKTNTAPKGSRKEKHADLSSYIEALKAKLDIMDVARMSGLVPDANGRAVCPHGHGASPTLAIDGESQTFRCLASECNDHGDVISLTQRQLRIPFEEAVNILAASVHTLVGTDASEEDCRVFGKVRDCLNASVRLFANSPEFALDYAERRGISQDTARRFMLGGSMGKDTLKRALLDQGFDEQTIGVTGLLNRYGEDRFQNHAVVPIFLNGQAVDFGGRLLEENDEMGKHWRLPSARFIVGRSLFNWQANREQVILVEGIFDALSLIENGFENAVALQGTNGIAQELIAGSCVKKVRLCFDGDAPGCDLSLKRAYELKSGGFNVKVAALPEGQDPNDFFKQHSADDFRALLRAAAHPETWEIERLDDGLDDEEKIAALEGVMRRVRGMEPMNRAAMIKNIASKMGLKEKDVREHIEALPENRARGGDAGKAEIIDLSCYELIHPALHHSDGATLMTIPLMGKNPKTGRTEWEPWVVTSLRELFPLRHEELNERGFYCNDIVCPGRQRYSQQVIAAFLKGDRSADLTAIFGQIKQVLQQYLDFSDPRTHDYLTAWIVGTHFFPLFNYYPYLHFTGTKEVGKSKAMKLMSQLCFNGIMSVSITDASQFRIITELLPTLLLDESENLADHGFSERRALLLGGYEKGSTAIRTEKVGDSFKTREFDNFSPRVFGSIDGLDDTLASRTIQIPMRRSFNEKIKEAEVTLTNRVFDELRDELFLVTMDCSETIRTEYEQSIRPANALFDAREWNLFKPILAIGASTGDAELVDCLTGFANATYSSKTEAFNETAIENVILCCLLEIVKEDGWYSFEAVHTGIVGFIKNQGLNVGVLSKNRLGTLLRNLHVADDKERRTVDGTKTIFYLIRPEQVKQVAENYRVS